VPHDPQQQSGWGLGNDTCGLMLIVIGTLRYLDLHLWFTCGCTWINWFTW
jgi:hypothetical protein